MVIAEFTDSFIFGTHVGIGIRTDCVNLQIVPESVAIRSSDSILNKVVVWVGDPETSWSLVSVETGPAALDFHDQVAIQIVLLLNSILNEDIVSFDFVNNIVHNSHVVRAVESVSAVEALVCGTTVHIGLVDSADLMEMNCVPANLESLSNICHLNVGDTADKAVVTL